MKKIISALIVPAALAMTVAVPVGPARTHGGGLDGYDGHHNRKQGTYHFHHGPLAGRTFSGKAEALDALRKYEEKTAPDRQQPGQTQGRAQHDTAAEGDDAPGQNPPYGSP